MFFSLAFKNIRRNVRRTVLSASAIFLVAIVLCLLFAFENGMVNDMMENVKSHVTGDIRIRNLQFSENERVRPLQFYIPDAQRIVEAINTIDGVLSANAQISTTVSIYRNDDNSLATVTGVDVGNSPFLHGKGMTMVDGDIPDQGSKEVVVTDTLAESLGLKVGDKFTFMTQTASRGTNGSTATVSGIVHIDDVDANSNNFFMDWRMLASILRMSDGALEILVRVSDPSLVDRIVQEINMRMTAVYPGSDVQLEVLPWDQVSVLYQMYQLMDLIYFYIGLLFFLIASTVIFNTTMMSVIERKHEIGTLISLGYGQRRVMHLFLLESAITSFFASALGTGIGAILVLLMHRNGFDLNALGGSSIGGMNFSSYVYPWLEMSKYLVIIAVGTCVAVLACLIPARKVLKVEPAEALRAEN